jgi:voltage-dependent potassium channel beta subunit
MQYRNLGKSGLKVSCVSLGSWVTFGAQIGDDVAERLMYTAYDAGINFFDNAEAYASGRSEEVMGKILKESKWDRSTFLVSSKVFWGGKKPNQSGLSRKHVVEACHAALKRLRVDYLDLYFCHRPDKTTPMEETVRAMSDLIQQGKVLYWGTSEWSAQEIMEAHMVARQYNLVPPVMEQPQYNMFHRQKMEADFLKIFRDIGLGTTIWSPLASGMLTPKYLKGFPEGTRLDRPGMEWLKEQFQSQEGKEKIQKAGALNRLAESLGTTLPCLAIAWCLKNPNVSTVILGASKSEQLTENLKALEALEKLDEGLMEKIEGILGNKPVLPQY